MMKRHICIIILTVLAMAGCSKETQTSLSEMLCGEWRGSELTVDAGIYVSLMADGSFELYQKLGNEEFELRRGTWSLDGDILSGSYNDGEPWSSSYKAAVSGDVLTLVAQDAGNETNIYSRTDIPAYIKENCTVVVRSAVL